MAYKKQRNYCSRLYKRERHTFYTNLDLRKVHDVNMFWKVVTPLFSDKGSRNEKITLVDRGEIITKDKDICETFNRFFKDAVSSLDIRENRFLLTETGDISDPVETAIKRFEVHPSILEIKANVTPSTFTFSEVTRTDIENQIKKLNPKKSGTFGDIPTNLLKLHVI